MRRIPRVDENDVLERLFRDGPNIMLTRGEARALIASRVKYCGENEKTARNRIGMKIDRSVENGNNIYTDGLPIQEGKLFLANDIILWGNRNFDQKFLDLPSIPPKVHAKAQSGFNLSGSFKAITLPATAAECHALIQSLYRELAECREAQRLAAEEHTRELVARFHSKKQD